MAKRMEDVIVLNHLVNKNFMVRRFIVYMTGLSIIACGSNLFVKSALGVAPFSSIAYALTFVFPISFSSATFILNALYLLLECLILKTISVSHIMQLMMSILYSFLLQLLTPFSNLFVVHSFSQQIYVAIAASILMAIGMTLMIIANFVVLPAEGFVGAIAFVCKKQFGNVKTYADIAVVVIAFLIAYLLVGKIAIGIGTLISALLTGNINKLFLRLFKRKLLNFMGVS